MSTTYRTKKISFYEKGIVSNIAILAFILLFSQSLFAQNQRYRFEQNLMGSPFKITMYAESATYAQLVADSIFARISFLNEVMSDYRDGSEINNLSASSGKENWIKVSDPLFDIIARADSISRNTKGSFDISVGPALKMWRLSMLKRTFPSSKTIRQASRKIGYKNIKLDYASHSVLLKKQGMKLDVGGIGKGYAADEGMRIAKQMGISSMMLDAGGDLVVSNPPPGKEGWQIDISLGNSSDEHTVVTISNVGIATSGATYRYIDYKGKRYSHIVDPKTGIGLLHHIRSTVIAPTGTLSDALATSISVLGVKKSKKMLVNYPEVKVWLQEEKEGKVIELNTILK